MQLVANLLEGLLSTCFTIPTSPTSADPTSGTTAPVPAASAPDLKRTVSVTSSSGLDQVESEAAPSESVSSTAFSQIQQVWHYSKTFKNFAWCLVACVIRLSLFAFSILSSFELKDIRSKKTIQW